MELELIQKSQLLSLMYDDNIKDLTEILVNKFEFDILTIYNIFNDPVSIENIILPKTNHIWTCINYFNYNEPYIEIFKTWYLNKCDYNFDNIDVIDDVKRLICADICDQKKCDMHYYCLKKHEIIFNTHIHTSLLNCKDILTVNEFKIANYIYHNKYSYITIWACIIGNLKFVKYLHTTNVVFESYDIIFALKYDNIEVAQYIYDILLPTNYDVTDKLLNECWKKIEYYKMIFKLHLRNDVFKFCWVKPSDVYNCTNDEHHNNQLCLDGYLNDVVLYNVDNSNDFSIVSYILLQALLYARDTEQYDIVKYIENVINHHHNKIYGKDKCSGLYRIR